MIVTNPTSAVLAVPGFPAFAPGEAREVSQTDAEILLRNPHLAEAVAEPGAENRETDRGAKRKAERTEARPRSKTP